MIFLVLCDWPSSSNFHNEILAGIESHCKANDIGLTIPSLSTWDSQQQADRSRYFLYKLLKHKTYDGIISFTPSLSRLSGIPKFLDFIKSMTAKPIVNLVERIPGEYSVVLDNRNAFEELLHHLCNHHGYRDFVYISGSLNNPDGKIRLDCMKSVLKQYNVSLPEDRIYFGSWMLESGYTGFKELIKHEPKVMVCANDYMALGAYNEALKQGYHIPEDLVITGFDNIQTNGLHDLPFTTVKQPFMNMGREAAEMLDDIIQGKDLPMVREIPTKLIIKESCGCWYDLEKTSQNTKSAILSQAFETMNEAFNREKRDPGKNFMIRRWNSCIQQFIMHQITEMDMQGLLNRLIRHWQETNDDKSIFIKMNWQIARLEKTINDNLNQQISGMAQEETDRMTQAHILTDRFSESVLSTLNLNKQDEHLHHLFTTLNKRNVLLIKFKGKGKDKTERIGQVIFAMKEGEVLPQCYLYEINLEEEIFPPVMKIHGFSSMLAQTLYVDSERYGVLLYDYEPAQTALNEYLSRSISGTLQTLENTTLLREKNQLLKEEIARRIESENKIQELLDELKNLSIRDQLTGLFNRRGFLTVGEQQIKQYLRDNEDYMVMFCDMDGLKIINDTYGHKDGDIAIKAMARVLEKSFRESDVVARLGGDEFVVLLGCPSPINMEKLDDRLKKNLAAINEELAKPYKIDFSYGMCSHDKSGEKNLAQIMEIADHEQYVNKKRKKGLI